MEHAGIYSWAVAKRSNCFHILYTQKPSTLMCSCSRALYMLCFSFSGLISSVHPPHAALSSCRDTK